MCGQEQIELSRDGNHYRLSTGILPSFGARIWETFLVVLVIYTAWVSPFEFGFLKGLGGPLSSTDNVVNGFFAIDIILTFFVAYLDKTTYLLVDDRKKIGWKYARSWFKTTYFFVHQLPRLRCHRRPLLRQPPHDLQPYKLNAQIRPTDPTWSCTSDLSTLLASTLLICNHLSHSS
ncbi:hypothetical protein ACFX13_023838 [Malus domestica]